MKTGIYGLLTFIFSGCAMMAGLNSGNIWTGYGVTGLAWAMFIWGCRNRARKASVRKFQEQRFQLYMRRVQQ